jgi:hypothetical protein
VTDEIVAIIVVIVTTAVLVILITMLVPVPSRFGARVGSNHRHEIRGFAWLASNTVATAWK